LQWQNSIAIAKSNENKNATPQLEIKSKKESLCRL
jgi:hypothetical protein